MKKILLSLFAVVAVGVAVQAQTWGYGPKVGITFSSANGVEGSKMRVGVVAGAFASRWINDWFAIQGELLYSQQGYNTKIAGVSEKFRLDYLTMPVLAKFYLIDGLNFEVGGQIAYRVAAKQKVAEAEFLNLKQKTNRFHADFICGLSYDFDFGLILEGRYLLSANSVGVGNGIKTGALQMLVGWRF
ncbi:MAG: PorT family protein [Rikenellaceae bacterium]|nr:PorT family protein [Rikenellaceae bacterium]MBR2419850.1 PorT family protein [Rikenellaceae bacterium]